MNGLLVVVAGPSGVGKGTVLDGVLAALPDAEKAVSATTRAPRPGEVDGRHYHFVDGEVFARLVADDALLEHAQFAGHWYGTLRAAVADRLAHDRVVILEIEVQGAAQVADRVPTALRIFLAPPDMEELRRRLADRGTESDAEVEARLERARVELAAADSFDHVVVNDDPDHAAHEVVELVHRARQRSRSDDGRAGSRSPPEVAPEGAADHDRRP